MNQAAHHHRQTTEGLEQALLALCDVTSLLTGRATLDEALEVVVRRTCEALGAAACALTLVRPKSGEFHLAAQFGLSEEYAASARRLAKPSPLEMEALQGKTVSVPDIQTDPRTRHPQPFIHAGLHSALLVPVAHHGRIYGLLKLYSREAHPLDGLETLLLRTVAAQIASAVAFDHLLEDRRAQAGMERQMQLAGEVQRRMIPSQPPKIPGFDIACTYEPTHQVGGDFFDFIPLPRHNVGFVIADVCGKGAPAALLMSAVRSAFRIHTQNIFEIRQIMAEINRQLVQDTLPSQFATVWYGVLDPVRMMLTYVNAGHECPFLLRGGEIRPLEKGGLVVGVEENETYEQDVVELKPHDVLLLYTDGVSEALNYDGEPFGRDRLQAALQKYASLTAGEILRNLRMDVWRFIGLKPQSDDMSLACIKVGGADTLKLSRMDNRR